MQAIGLPPDLPPDWQARALEKLDELLHKYRSLQVYLDICVRCGACADKCPFFRGTGDPKNMPVARAELLRKVYRYYYTAGKKSPKTARAEPLTEETLKEWFTYFYQCSECRRCSVFCPFGIDTAEITIAAREIMASVGIANKYVSEVIANVYRTGNNIGIPDAAWKDNCEFLEEELKDETGLDIRLPVDEEGVDVLLVPPSADNFVNLETMKGYAKVFHAAGISWTTSAYASEAANFGLFLNFHNMKRINRRIVEEARRLKVKKIVFGECGHAWRAAMYTATLNGPLDFLETPYPIHCTEFTLALLKQGAIKLDPTANDEYIVTYHDPCNVARAGGPLEEPRALLKASCNHFEEMPAHTIREYTFCCGGGGGLLSDEVMEVRMAGGKMRAEALKTTRANRLATICAICKAQFRKLLPHYEIEAEVEGVHSFVGRAILLNRGG
ncbi:MAG: (Fe-S)-binding protein [Caldilineae bacterium]|nr:MAG: (Fe-S)-binding protein [Caldilineae bacterium]